MWLRILLHFNQSDDPISLDHRERQACVSAQSKTLGTAYYAKYCHSRSRKSSSLQGTSSIVPFLILAVQQRSDTVYSPYFSLQKRYFLFILFCNKNCIYLSCTPWCFNTHIHSKRITIVKLIKISSLHIFLCVWWEHLKSILLANFQYSISIINYSHNTRSLA